MNEFRHFNHVKFHPVTAGRFTCTSRGYSAPLTVTPIRYGCWQSEPERPYIGVFH